MLCYSNVEPVGLPSAKVFAGTAECYLCDTYSLLSHMLCSCQTNHNPQGSNWGRQAINMQASLPQTTLTPLQTHPSGLLKPSKQLERLSFGRIHNNS